MAIIRARWLSRHGRRWRSVLDRWWADYRDKTLEISFEPGVKDEYGEVEHAERFHVSFKADEWVDDADISSTRTCRAPCAEMSLTCIGTAIV